MLTVTELFRQLSAMGVPQDKPIVVHTSLKAIGETEGRAEGLLAGLTEYVTAKGGLLVVPAHTWDNFFAHVTPTLDLTSDHTCIGTFPRIAAQSPFGYRSAHPTHSVVVFGDRDRALAFIAHDEDVRSMSDPAGCMGQVEREDGCILLIGVGQDKNTYLHTVEEELQVKNRMGTVPCSVSVRRSDGTSVRKQILPLCAEGIGDVSANYPVFQPAFEYHHAVVRGKIGGADSMLCRARMLKAVLRVINERKGEKEVLADKTPLDPSLYENADPGVPLF